MKIMILCIIQTLYSPSTSVTLLRVPNWFYIPVFLLYSFHFGDLYSCSSPHLRAAFPAPGSSSRTIGTLHSLPSMGPFTSKCLKHESKSEVEQLSSVLIWGNSVSPARLRLLRLCLSHCTCDKPWDAGLTRAAELFRIGGRACHPALIANGHPGSTGGVN